MIKQSTIKVDSDGYFVSHNEIFRNREISARAKGLHGFLRSNSPAFNITMYELYTFFKEGRDAICTAFKELEAWGYITKTYVPITLDDGRKIRRVDYTVHATSKLAANGLQGKMRNKQREKGDDRHRRKAKRVPDSDFQDTENQGSENQRPENPCAIEDTTGSEINTFLPENVEGRDAGASASSLPEQGGGIEGGGCPCPPPGADGTAADRARESRKGKPGKTVSKTPQDAPWSGTKYSGMARSDLPTVASYEDICMLCGEDPIIAAMAVTGELMSGGYGFWIKWLNSMCEFYSVEESTATFSYFLSQTWGEKDCDGIRNPAAIFNNKLKAFMEVK